VEFRCILAACAKFFRIVPRGARALHRARGDAAGCAIDRQEEFGAERQQCCVIVEFEKRAVARGGGGQGVQRECARRASDTRAKPAGDVRLEDVAGEYVLACAFHHGLECCTACSAIDVERTAQRKALRLERRPHIDPFIGAVADCLADIEPPSRRVAVHGGARDIAQHRIGPELASRKRSSAIAQPRGGFQHRAALIADEADPSASEGQRHLIAADRFAGCADMVECRGQLRSPVLPTVHAKAVAPRRKHAES